MPRKGEPSYKSENSVFATRLREIMKERGENQTTLADKITSQYVTIQRQTISLYMSGQSRPDTERLTAIAKVLDVSADWLLGLTGSKKKEPLATDELRLTDEAVDTIVHMDSAVRSVLCLLLEQETYCGESERMEAEYLKGESYAPDFHLHILQRITDFFRIRANNSNDCYITDTGDIYSADQYFDLWTEHMDGTVEFLGPDFSRSVPIETEKLIEEAFLSDIRSMLISLKERYQASRK